MSGRAANGVSLPILTAGSAGFSEEPDPFRASGSFDHRFTPTKGTFGCPADEETLCLLDGRFTVTAAVLDPSGSGLSRPAAAMARRDRFGDFAFGSERHPDVVVKILDGRHINGRFWIYGSASLSQLPYELSVTDLATGRQQSYVSMPSGSTCGVVDTTSFVDTP